MTGEHGRKVIWRGIGLACGALAVVLALEVLSSGEDHAGRVVDEMVMQPAQASATARTANRFRAQRPKLQRRVRANSITPKPGGASRGDRGRIWERGCMLQPPQTRSKACAFARRKSSTTAVLFGDSHAMHVFGAVNRLAQRRGWRLLGLTKAGCPPFLDTPVYNPRLDRRYRECEQWHRNLLERLDRIGPQIIFTGAAVSIKPTRNGRVLRSGAERRRILRQGYERMLERLTRTGARVVALKDVPSGPRDMTDCVRRNMNRLGRCTFNKGRNYGKTFESQAARTVPQVSEIDLSPGICRGNRCFGVIRNMLAYRDNDHLTATFARRALAPWLARGLRRSGR